MEGILVNQHLGEAEELLIYGQQNNRLALLETRKTPDRGTGMQRWKALSALIRDCQALLVSGIGTNPKNVLTRDGINVLVLEGVIDEAVTALMNGSSMNHLIKRTRTACGAECSGTGGGCG
jgi:nitrogen fixation protein NifB